MEPITLPGTALVTSRLGLGCAELYREPSAVARRRLLDAAYDAGVRHFDVAPMYGLGIAEAELGRAARGREDLVIATKFGISPTALAGALARVQGPVRRLFAALPALRQRARASAAGPAGGTAGALLYRAAGFTAEAARASLERSLRRVGRDHLELLLLHDPQPGSVASDELCAYLEHARDVGDIVTWGVAGEPAATLQVARALPVSPPVLQTRYDALEPSSPLDGEHARAWISFGILGRALSVIPAHVAADASRCRAWRESIGADCADREALARILVRYTARANPGGVLLFGTIRSEHLRATVAALDEDGGEIDLDRFGLLLDAELRQLGPRAEP
jgi:D-threo-aldose 1-dehydrogenase